MEKTHHVHVLEDPTGRVYEITIKFRKIFFTDTNRIILNLHEKAKERQQLKQLLKEKNKEGGISPSVFITYFMLTVIKTIQGQQKNRHINQWNRRQNPVIDPHKHAKPVFDKRVKTIQLGKNSLLATCAGAIGHSKFKKKQKQRNKQKLKKALT